MRKNRLTFQIEGAAPAVSSLKSSYIKNEEKLFNERGTLKLLVVLSVVSLVQKLVLMLEKNL